MAEETTESVVENGGNVVPDGADVASFAALLKKENAERIGETETDDAQPEAPKPKLAKEPAKTAEPSADIAAIKAAFDAGDVAKLAELVGADPRSTKVTKSQWAEYRVKTKQARHQLDEQRNGLEQERAKFASERESHTKVLDEFNRAREAAASEDYERAIEIVTGKKIGDVIDALAAEVQNPGSRELRRARRELEQEREKTRAEQEQIAQQRQQAEQQAAKMQYLGELKSTIANHAAAKPFLDEYGPEFVGLVFAEIEGNWRKGVEVTQDAAIKTVLRNQLAAYDRGKEFFEGLRESLGQTGADKPKSVQGNQGARLSPRKPTTSSQGGAAPAKPMTEQEDMAHWAKQLKAENAARLAR